MKELENTLSALIERWEDPGDYPSNAGSGPLPSFDYLAGMEGEVKFELTDEELTQFIEAVEVGEEQEWIREKVEYKDLLPREIADATWSYKVEGNVLTLWAEGQVEPSWEGCNFFGVKYFLRR